MKTKIINPIYDVALADEKIQWELQQQQNIDDYFDLLLEKERSQKEEECRQKEEIIQEIINCNFDLQTTLKLTKLTETELLEFKNNLKILD